MSEVNESTNPAPWQALIVDDEPAILRLLGALLAQSGMLCTSAGSLADARKLLGSHPQGAFDVILLDVTLKDGDGWMLLEELRSGDDETPVIFVTSDQLVDDRVRALRSGADDYVIKPFHGEELRARVEAVVRRRRSLPVLVCADLRVCLGSRSVERAGLPVDLSPTEFEIVRVLLEARGETVSRMELLRDVWGLQHDPGTSLVEVLVSRLRKKLDRRGVPLVETVTGHGYRICGRDHGSEGGQHER